ncbi:MAG: 30S ribosomal protein S1 [Parachlamydiales bacterium]|nr:30S ribosomal protein S1 [Parachlamydiales bacterium]
MTKPQYDWSNQTLLDNEPFLEKDAAEFQSLLFGQEKIPSEDISSQMIAGTLITGKIVEITKDFAIVDVGLKSEGLVAVSEFVNPKELKLGKVIELLLDKTEDEEGQIVLSLEKARRQKHWDHIINNCTEGSIIEGRVIRKVKGGLIVDIGVEAFLPGSQIDNKRIKNLDDLLGQTFNVKILKINIERKNIVVSRRELLEEEKAYRKTEVLEHLKVGEIVKGVVKNVTDFGAFIELEGGIDGLLHITDMTWKRIRHPSEIVKIGDILEVMILSIDHEKGRVALGLKQKEENPWELVEKKYPPGTKVQGKIVNLLPYGAFLEIEDGIEGLIHVSEMSWTKNITDPNEVVKVGDVVDAIVLSIQKDEGKISLGIKQTQKNPWEGIEQKFPVGSILKVKVRNFTNFGAFVEVDSGVEGLIHISDLSWIKKVSHPSEILQKGDEVEAKVLSVDSESKKITLGLKQLTQNPWETIEKEMPVGSIVKGTVAKTTAFGIFVQLENGIEALVHVTDISDQPFGKVEDVVSIGAPIEAKVIKLDPQHKKIALSIKDFLIENNKVNRDDIIVGKEPKRKS